MNYPGSRNSPGLPGGALTRQCSMNDLPYTDIDYCKYGTPYRKIAKLSRPTETRSDSTGPASASASWMNRFCSISNVCWSSTRRCWVRRSTIGLPGGAGRGRRRPLADRGADAQRLPRALRVVSIVCYAMLCYAMLCYTILYCTTLYYNILCYTILSTILYYTIL